MERYVGAIDQGTTSTRFILFNRAGKNCFSHQIEHKQYFPKPGYVEHNPYEIWENCLECIAQTFKKAEISSAEVVAIGITNQRETVVAWNKKTGKVYYNAIVWQDLRGETIINKLSTEGGIDKFREKCGLPLSPYFSASKLMWLVDNCEDFRKDIEKKEAIVGTIDTWILWNLTGGVAGGVHYTDVTNASRTLLMDIKKLNWDVELLKTFKLKDSIMPEIKSSIPIKPYGWTIENSVFKTKVPITAVLGDQQAALFGQTCWDAGMSKATYGTGCFLLMNTGEKIVNSDSGLITTLAYKIGNDKPVYALEGSVAIAGSLIQWFRDNLSMIKKSKEIDKMALEVADNGGVFFVPAFSGLYAPYWRSDARGVICGLTGYVNKNHIARAILEASAFQCYDIFNAMIKDSGIKITELKVDGGMTNSLPLMQFQADILSIPLMLPKINETTALGVSFAAGLAVEYWKNFDEIKKVWKVSKTWEANMEKSKKMELIQQWHKAIKKSYGWNL